MPKRGRVNGAYGLNKYGCLLSFDAGPHRVWLGNRLADVQGALAAGRMMDIHAREEVEMIASDDSRNLTDSTLDVIDRFNAAFNRHDVDTVMALMTDDCVFENTSSPPDGERYEGQQAVRAFWERMFASTPSAHFDAEDIFAAGDRCTVRWRYTWMEADGTDGHVRGVDVFRVRDGKVAEKLSYVKG